MEKAYIEKVISPHEYKVRIPRLYKTINSNNSIDTEELPTAQVCTLPGCIPAYLAGDLVWVEFEYGRSNYPIIMGKVYLGDSSSIGITLEQSVSMETDVTQECKQEIGIIKQRLYELEKKS